MESHVFSFVVMRSASTFHRATKGSSSTEAEYRDRRISAADFGSDHVVHTDKARHDRYVLLAAGTVGDRASGGRAT